MLRALCCLTLVAGALGPCSRTWRCAAATVTLDEDTGVLRIAGDAAADTITTLQDASQRDRRREAI